MATRKGIELSWQFSLTKTVVKHILQRKPIGFPTWTVVLDIDNSQQASYAPQAGNTYN
jgi:hypothetical protein